LFVLVEKLFVWLTSVFEILIYRSIETT